MRDTMEFIKKNKKYFVLGGAILLALIISIFIYNKFDNDGMNNKNIFNVKYKVSQNNKWTKYAKDGKTIGDKVNPIQNIEFKYKEDKGRIFYNVYTTDWSEQNYSAMKENQKEIYGIKINTSNTLYKKYEVCYRTYNKKDKWLNWSCHGEINGNKGEPITALEVKIIPKGAVKFDYLKDFNETLDKMINF